MNKERALRHYSLVYPVYRFPVNQITVLLGLQKTGKWEGYLNGFGGKNKERESSHDSARRELLEETGLQAEQGDLTHHGKVIYEHENEEFRPSSVYLYFYEKWKGEIPKGGELDRNLFRVRHNEIPFDKMPPHDNLWLPRILKGEFIQARLTYETRNDAFLLKTVKYNNAVWRLRPLCY